VACQLVLLDAHEPWMTGRLVYPDAWWRLDLVGLRDPVLAEVETALGGE
jgi:putative acetyltransferase